MRLFPLWFVMPLLCLAGVTAFAQPVPLIARWTGAAEGGRLVDAGPMGYSADLGKAVSVAEGHNGPALRFAGPDSVVRIQGDYLKRATAYFTITCWIKFDRRPARSLYLIGNGYNTGFQLSLTEEGRPWIHGNWGGGWYHGGFGPILPPGEWAYVALSFRKGDKARLYVNAKEVAAVETPFAVWPVDDPFMLCQGDFNGLLSEIKVYAAALSPEQIAADMAGKLETRKPVEADLPTSGFPVKMALVRFDMPIGDRWFDGRVKQEAVRVPGPEAVDWPKLTLNDGRALFVDSARTDLEVPLAPEPKNRPLFRQPYDNVIEPTGHWFRALPWIWGQHFIYTTDRTARPGTGEYELWTFPVKIAGEGERPIRKVLLKLDGRTVYERAEELHSLTLCLPANLNGNPYELTVNDRGPARFNVGLEAYEPGRPREIALKVDVAIPGEGPAVRVRSLDHPETFPQQADWDADLKAMAEGKTAVPPLPEIVLDRMALRDHIGLEVPRSPITINLMSMMAGMSGGQYFDSPNGPAFKGTLEQYAQHVARMGFDRCFETITNWDFPNRKMQYDEYFIQMARHGVLAGLNISGYGSGSMLGNPNLAFYAYNLPEWRAPQYRDYQLFYQRFLRYPNQAGVLTGADNAGYVPYWDWAPPIPNRPWGRAFVQFRQGRSLTVPVGPGLEPNKDYEVRAKNEREFLDYIARYDQTFRMYGYFADAVREINPAETFVIGSYGSSPGVGGRGGWPWATIPGKPMHERLDTLQTYDWNELAGDKPLHNVALIDRLQSYYPGKPTWAILDDFKLLLGREARQRKAALALTRGVQGIGTNFLAQTTVDQTELYAWIHKYGGVYAMTRPLPTIGILYVHEQAISRPVFGDERLSDERLYKGSHEGKTTEALFLCHAAGYPPRIITPEELKRGLPATMKAVLLVGLNRFDDSWVWHEGLEAALKGYVAKGGRILTDDESVCPLPTTSTGMRVAAYVPQSDIDPTPLLLTRNAENIGKLRQALAGIGRPVCASDEPTIWAVPTTAGDMQCVTVVNLGWVEGKSATQVVKPQTGKLAWDTKRPIYDVRAGRRLTAAEAATVDLTKEGFQFYALPPAAVTKPQVKVSEGKEGLYQATVTVANPKPMMGVPVELTVSEGQDSATVYTATGLVAKLPLAASDAPAIYTVTAKELLSGLMTQVKVEVPIRAHEEPRTPQVQVPASALAAFAARKARPLTVALTETQAQDAAMQALAQRLVAYYAKAGRKATVETIKPNGLVLGRHELSPAQRFPQWHTRDTDVILLGSARDNVLLFDQARGYLLPEGADKVEMGRAIVSVTYSPFAGEYEALNVIAGEGKGLAAGVESLESCKSI